MTFDPSMNQPQKWPVMLREIELRADYLSNGDWWALARIRPKIKTGKQLEAWEEDRLFNIWKYSGWRKEKRRYPDFRDEEQKKTKNWVN